MTVRGTFPQFYQVPVVHETSIEKRARNIKNRLARLESAQRNLQRGDKWPTQKSIDSKHFQQRCKVPEIIIHPPTPDENSYWSSSSPARPSPRTLQRLLAPATSPRSVFPFPISSGTSHAADIDRPFMDCSFIYFQFLPVELRLQIWEIELRRPKFIEAQFSTQFGAPAFVGACTRGSVLAYVSRESRELALSVPWEELKPRPRDIMGTWTPQSFALDADVAEKSLLFAPDDTIFFRSLDQVQGGLQSLMFGVCNFEAIQHLALPLPSSGLGLRNEWKRTLSLFRDLKTLTFLVGGKDQSWVGEGDVELRDAEEWYADGRDRTVKVGGWILDIGEVGRYLGGVVFEERMKGSWDADWKGVNVRCVAWKKGL